MKAHVLATKINSILTDNKFDRFVGGKARGKLDFAALSKVAYSDKIFKKREARKNKDYKVIVLADASGSMYGDNARSTAKALNMLNEALSKTDVEYALWSFNGDIISIKDFKEAPKGETEAGDLYKKHLYDRYVIYCRKCDCIYGTFNSYGREATCPNCGKESDSDYYGDTKQGCAYNADGLALHLAVEKIRELSGEHIVVVLSDGGADAIPTHSHNVRYMTPDGLKYKDMRISLVAKKAIKEGIVLCSIGIDSNDVLLHYPKENTIVVKNAAGVGPALVALISKQIKRG